MLLSKLLVNIHLDRWFYSVFRSMSGPTVSHLLGHQRTGSRSLPKEFSVATPEEFVKRFGGVKVINKVRESHSPAAPPFW